MVRLACNLKQEKDPIQEQVFYWRYFIDNTSQKSNIKRTATLSIWARTNDSMAWIYSLLWICIKDPYQTGKIKMCITSCSRHQLQNLLNLQLQLFRVPESHEANNSFLVLSEKLFDLKLLSRDSGCGWGIFPFPWYSSVGMRKSFSGHAMNSYRNSNNQCCLGQFRAIRINVLGYNLMWLTTLGTGCI